MKKSSKLSQQTKLAKPDRSVGLDLGDRFIHYCILNQEGEVIEEGRMQNSESALRKHFGNEAVMRIAMEAGTHSPWVSRLLKRLGHQVLVANPRKIRAITGSESKNDRNDAEQLARFAAYDPKLLSPIEHRSEQRQQDLNLIHARATLVRARTMIINVVRGLVKSAGGRLPSCSTESFAERTPAAIPAPLTEVATPLVRQIGMLTAQIELMDKQIDQLVRKYPEISVFRTRPEWGRWWPPAMYSPWTAPMCWATTARRGLSSVFVRGRASRASPTPSDASRKPATPTCAAYWCSRHNIFWAASVPTRHCAVGASS